MMSDAISHAILPGLVAGYVLAQGPNLLAGFIGASLAAIATVTAVEAMQRTRLVDGGAAIGIVFPAMFALGTVLVTRQFSDVHLDADAILFGNIEFVAFDTLTIDGRDLGPQSIWVMSLLCADQSALHRHLLQGAEADHLRPRVGGGARVLPGHRPLRADARPLDHLGRRLHRRRRGAGGGAGDRAGGDRLSAHRPAGADDPPLGRDRRDLGAGRLPSRRSPSTPRSPGRW